MAKRTHTQDDILWKMLERELQMPEVQELQGYLAGATEHYEMGYGDLSIEPYDAGNGLSAIFRLRHPAFGETTVSRSALRSVLHDLTHYLRR